jgi:hypothetical protein
VIDALLQCSGISIFALALISRFFVDGAGKATRSFGAYLLVSIL